MQFHGIHHVAVSVQDMAKARTYYVDLLGMTELGSGRWSASAKMDLILGVTGSAGKSMMLRAGNAFVEVFEFESPRDPVTGEVPRVNRFGYTHICLDVSDVDAIYTSLSEAGLKFHSEPQALSGVKTVYSRDPFGNIVEFQQIDEEGRVERLSTLTRETALRS